MKNVPPCNTVQGNCRIPSIRWITDETSLTGSSCPWRARLRDALVQDGQAVVELEQRIDTLRRIKEGLEIAVENKPAEEIPYLSQPLFSLGIQPSAQNHLTAYGLRYVGDLVRRDEQYLMEIWGIGPATVERIKTKLNENGACLDMDVIRVDNRWYRRKTD